MAFLRDLGEVEQRKGEAITKLDSLASQVGQNNAQVRQLHNNLSSILENAISQHLAKLNEQ